MPRPRPPQEHGSVRGYWQHGSAKTVACRPCLAAWSAYAKQQRDKGRCARGLGWPLLPGAVARG